MPRYGIPKVNQRSSLIASYTRMILSFVFVILQLPHAISSKLSIFVYFKVAPKYLKNLREIFLKYLQNFSKISEFFDNFLEIS